MSDSAIALALTRVTLSVLPHNISLLSSGVLLFYVVDLFAIAVVVAVINVFRVKFGKQWWNSLEEVESPLNLLLIDLLRRRLLPAVEGTIGYGVVWLVVASYWFVMDAPMW